jgi:hypothetical protein
MAQAQLSRCYISGRDRAGAVERCLACEAVESKAVDVEGGSVGSAIGCEDVRHRAPTEIRRASRFTLANHGLASEAALHVVAKTIPSAGGKAL